MKKLLSILLVLFVLCGCGGSKLFYKTTEQPLIQNLGSELPYYIDVYSDDKFNSTGIDDEQTIKTIVDLIKKIFTMIDNRFSNREYLPCHIFAIYTSFVIL